MMLSDKELHQQLQQQEANEDLLYKESLKIIRSNHRYILELRDQVNYWQSLNSKQETLLSKLYMVGILQTAIIIGLSYYIFIL